MTGPKIFISFTWRDEVGKEASGRLYEKLESAGFLPFRDRERLEKGEAWHEGLQEALSCCHGAVVLLSPKVVESDWVRTEATIFTHRKHICRDFVLLPVLVGDARREQMTGLGLGGLGAFQSFDGDQETVLDQVVGHDSLNDLKHLFGTLEPESRLELKIAQTLARALSGRLLDMAAVLGVSIEGWAGDDRLSALLARHIAAKVVQSDIVDVANALGTVLADIGAGGAFAILKELAPGWIDIDAARLLRSAARDRSQTFAINSSSDWTYGMYARRAACHPLGWPRLEPLNINGGEDQAEDIIAGLAAELTTRLGRFSLKEAKKKLATNPEPVLGCLLGPVPNPVLSDVRHDFADLTLIVADPDLDAPTTHDRYPGVTFIEPALTDRKEQKARDLNAKAKQRLDAQIEALRDGEL